MLAQEGIMNRRVRLVPVVAIALVTSVLCAPLTYAEGSTEAMPAAPAAVSPENPEPAPLRFAATVDWSRTTAVTNVRFAPKGAYRLEEAAAPAGGQPRSRLSKGLMIGGFAAMAIGGVMVAAGSSQDEVGESGVAINWKTTGFIWIGAGAVLAVIGLIKH
jgi:hypothetical protein